MIRRRARASPGTDSNGGSPAGTDNQGYTVGYGKPPIHSRFPPGQSGNPAGRRKGVRNLKTDVKRTLAMPVRVKESGRARKTSTQESALMVLREQALKGNGRALDRLLGLAAQFNNDAAEIGSAAPVAADDQAILDAYLAECMGKQLTPAAAEPAKNLTQRWRTQKPRRLVK